MGDFLLQCFSLYSFDLSQCPHFYIHVICIEAVDSGPKKSIQKNKHFFITFNGHVNIVGGKLVFESLK